MLYGRNTAAPQLARTQNLTTLSFRPKQDDAFFFRVRFLRTRRLAQWRNLSSISTSCNHHKKIFTTLLTAALPSPSHLCVKLNSHSRSSLSRLPAHGASGSVQRGPANPARPGREQRYRDRLGCRRSPEVPLTEKCLEWSVVGFQPEKTL